MLAFGGAGLIRLPAILGGPTRLAGAGVCSPATSFRSQWDVDDDNAVLHNPKASACSEDQARSMFTSGSLPPGATVSKASSHQAGRSRRCPVQATARRR